MFPYKPTSKGLNVCVDPLTTIALGAAGSAANEGGKAVGKGLPSGAGKIASRVKKQSVDKAIENRSAFSDYLQRACANISRSKTLLSPQPTSIEKFFEPIAIEVNKGLSSTKKSVSLSTKYVSTKCVDDVLRLGDRLIIAGHAGAGKSILMRHLFIDACRGNRFLPIYVELRAINQAKEETTVIDLLYQFLHRFGCTFTQEDFCRNLDNQDFLILLDGLDEVSDSRMEMLREGIDNLGNEHPRIKIILSSRLSEDEFRSWENYVVAKTVELSKNQAISLIKKQEFYDADAKELFARELEARLYESHKSFASNPLLLTMMLMLFSERAAIPDDLTEFYSQTFDTLFRQHDANKRGKYHRELKCGLSDEEFKRVFSNFCFITFVKDEFSFTGTILMDRIGFAINRILGDEKNAKGTAFFRDLLESVCMLQRDGSQYSFVHRSFQEYFAAVYTMNLDDDEKLRKVVVAWIHSHTDVWDSYSSVYLRALTRLNPNRLERQVIFKVLKKLRDTCFQSEQPRYAYLKERYDGIELDYRMYSQCESNYYSKYTIAFCLKQRLYYVFIKLLMELHPKVKAKRYTLKPNKGCEEKLISYLESFSDHEATFAEIEAAGLVDTVLGYSDMGATVFFETIEQMEKQYEEMDKASVFDELYNL